MKYDIIVLDVGCGSFPQGNVNCDLFIKDEGHRLQEGTSINVKNIKNFVLCDSRFLPFRDGSFDKVISSHLIEHVKDPIQQLDEMVRVSNCLIELLCPHWLGEKLDGINPYHLSHFQIKWFAEYARKKGLICRCNITRYLGTKLGLVLPLRIPLEIHVLFSKSIKRQNNT